ncbi:hypothetical protein L830_0845 [Mycobacteroides abscessus MAB_082312_2258]|nr:hypothetical protein L830_0845 [Mycobacteroides abscessus MAB_082312_2258]
MNATVTGLGRVHADVVGFRYFVSHSLLTHQRFWQRDDGCMRRVLRIERNVYDEP